MGLVCDSFKFILFEWINKIIKSINPEIWCVYGKGHIQLIGCLISSIYRYSQYSTYPTLLYPPLVPPGGRWVTLPARKPYGTLEFFKTFDRYFPIFLLILFWMFMI